jgi:hypothetical protein
MENIIICLNCDYRDEAKNFEIELVRFEDAQKLEDRINYLDADRERMERLYSQALQKIGHLELKQKLQQLRRRFVDEFTFADRFYEKNELQEKIKKILDEFEKELLKEEKAEP